MTREELLKIWFETDPTARSPYGLYEYPPMWKTMTKSDAVLFTRPGKVMVRPHRYAPYKEVDGIHYQWQRDGKWVGQGYQTTFEDFEKEGPECES